MLTDTADHRLLPRFRQSPLLERRHMERRQAAVLTAAMDADPDAKLPLRHELTKPGDPIALRGVPIQAKGVGGTVRGSSPEQETLKRLTRAERVTEATRL